MAVRLVVSKMVGNDHLGLSLPKGVGGGSETPSLPAASSATGGRLSPRTAAHLGCGALPYTGMPGKTCRSPDAPRRLVMPAGNDAY